MHLVVLLPDGAKATSLLAALNFHLRLVAGKLAAATSLVLRCPCSCFILVILFQQLAWVLLLAARCLLLVAV